MIFSFALVRFILSMTDKNPNPPQPPKENPPNIPPENETAQEPPVTAAPAQNTPKAPLKVVPVKVSKKPYDKQD